MLASGNEEYVRLSRANKRGYAAKLGYGVCRADLGAWPAVWELRWLSLIDLFDVAAGAYT